MIEPISTVSPAPYSGGDHRPPAPRPAEPAAEPAPAEHTLEVVERALRKVEPPILKHNERLSISQDEATGTFIYRSVNRDTGEVVRQWPAESMLQFRAYLRETAGVVVDRQI